MRWEEPCHNHFADDPKSELTMKWNIPFCNMRSVIRLMTYGPLQSVEYSKTHEMHIEISEDSWKC